ncbi:ABC transporter ATP-binding protein [Radicibacter daui]|uniref:ABC transporter ATP-binding protein n=1 Tax=Radicibacter daui TaxID=3064829 RepID=UPI004046A05E
MGRIELVGVTKRFGTAEVIPELSLEIEPGEFAVLLGPSGCGKSTLLRMMAGLEALTAGEIHIGGRRVDGLPPGQRGVAMVFQSYALYPHMSVADNLAFGLRNIGMAKEEIATRTREAARILEIEHLLERKPMQLSGGQRQRVAIGRAIVKEPQAFLFDEPLSNLDAALRARTRVEIARLHQRMGSTMIFVTHDQVEAMTMATRIVVLNKGRIEQIGSPLEIYRRPATRFVAGFIGTPGMNFLPVDMAEGAGGHAEVVLPGGTRLATGIPSRNLPSNAGSLTLGVRPEAVRVNPDGPVKAEVEFVEHLGDRTHLHVALPGGAQLVVEDAGESVVRAGEHIALTADGARLHLFDAADRAYSAA